MKSRIMLGLLIVIILVSGCAKNQITASAIKDLPIEQKIELEAKIAASDVCMNVACSSNSRCIAGDCVCNDGYKKCNGECILSQDCCTDYDCSLGESCIGRVCVPDYCLANEVFDAGKGKCVCEEDFKYCELQRACIPKANCCMQSDCAADYRCIPSVKLALICISSETKQCRSVHPERAESFLVQGMRYDVQINAFLSSNGMDIDVNGVSYILSGNDVKKLSDSASIYISEIEDIGGHCKKE